MKRIVLLLACASALFLAACGGETKLPNPTGKGSIRAINAIPGSPEYAFKIEERTIGGVSYKNSTAPADYDDLDYVFNFDVRFLGDEEITRVASQALKVEANRNHVFLLSGDVTAPTITLWNHDKREWDGSETVFEARFSHGSETLGDIDIYFDPEGTVPGTVAPAATLSFGEIGDAIDFADNETYVMTITAAGDLNTVHFTSAATALLPRYAHIITVFDGDGNNVGPVAVRSMTAVGNPLGFPDAAQPPKIRFIHSAYTLEPVDIYDDELLTSQVAANLPFKAATADIDTSSVAKTYYFTPANSTATVLFEQQIGPPVPGTFAHVYAVGSTDAWGGARFVPDRAIAATGTKLRIFSGANNFALFDVYLKNHGEPVADEDRLLFLGAAYSRFTPIALLTPGNYDIYLTEQGNKTLISDDFEIDVVDGDIVDLIAVDTVDPTFVELIDVPVP